MRCPFLSELPAPPPGKRGWPWTEESSLLRDRLLDGRPWPRISVVTPSFNQAEFIEETIRSVLLQGYPDLEYIIVDGGSTDGSLEIIHRYQPWLAYWISEPDSGQAHAINKGWMRASGDNLAYINADDCYLAGALAAATREFHADGSAGMVYGMAMIVNEAGQELRTWEARPFDLRTMLTSGSIVPQPAAFFSAQALKSVGYLDQAWHMIMDYELCIRIGLRFPSVCLPRALARFRDHAQSKSRLRFEATANELIAFINAFGTDQVSAQDLQTIKRITLSRVHYEWALACLAHGRQEPSRALRQFLKSVRCYPPFALERPLASAYILKEVLLSLFTSLHARSMVKSRPNGKHAERV